MVQMYSKAGLKVSIDLARAHYRREHRKGMHSLGTYLYL